MKKGSKVLLTLIILLLFLLLLFIIYFTYASYSSSIIGTVNAEVAAWVVKINNSNVVSTNTFTFTSSDIVWDNSVSNAKPGTIAPGSIGTIKILIDADGSKLPMDYTVSIGSITAGESTISSDAEFSVVGASDSSLTGTIAQSDTEGAMRKTVLLKVTWASSDSTFKNNADVGLANAAISIPITVTTTQHLN